MKYSAKQSAAPAPLLRRGASAGVVTLTLDNPASRNALSLAMIEALSGALADAAVDNSVRAIVIAAEGPAFSSGHDLREIAGRRNDRDAGKEFYERLMEACAQMMQAIVALQKPVIAAVEGVATAAGCQLVAACDLAIAGTEARFATPGVNIGLFCSTPLVAIGRAISRKHAMEMALTGALYSASEAERFGLINRIVAAGRRGIAKNIDHVDRRRRRGEAGVDSQIEQRLTGEARIDREHRVAARGQIFQHEV